MSYESDRYVAERSRGRLDKALCRISDWFADHLATLLSAAFICVLLAAAGLLLFS